MTNVAVIIGIMIVVLFFVSFIFSYLNEIKKWNNGNCIKCGTPVTRFDMDSQGGRGYKCTNCDFHFWIDFHSVDAGYVEPVKAKPRRKKKS